ncbi:unnamed protein product [Pleuronectes platessa]|uniref:Uncharacterized protein n=1 Tax=Pleuronectes platessa TaxID=8262 RepID=A0A9N7VWP2_PLEPL|nr:unnamed protein product [Pleuronectes platessa]
MTERWPLVIFHNIIDVSSYNAFATWREINPDWMLEAVKAAAAQRAIIHIYARPERPASSTALAAAPLRAIILSPSRSGQRAKHHARVPIAEPECTQPCRTESQAKCTGSIEQATVCNDPSRRTRRERHSSPSGMMHSDSASGPRSSHQALAYRLVDRRSGYVCF